jgi:hypothetical protein
MHVIVIYYKCTVLSRDLAKRRVLRAVSNPMFVQDAVVSKPAYYPDLTTSLRKRDVVLNLSLYL